MEVTEEVKEKGFTKERLEDVNNGKLRIGDLNPTERKQVREYAKTRVQIEVQEEDVNEIKDTPKEEIKPEDAALKALKTKLFDTQVSDNRNNQLLKKQTANLDFVTKQLEALKSKSNITARTDDNFDDATQENTIQRVEFLETALRESLEREQVNVAQQRDDSNVVRQDLEDQRSELSIKKLQDSFPDLKTSVPISQLDGELTRFMGEVGGIDNVNKYLEDPEFRKQKEAEGVTPLSDAFIENKDRFGKVVEINHAFSITKDAGDLTYRDRNSDATIESFHMKNQLESGAYTEQLRNAKLTGANAVIDKVVSQKHTAPTMSPSSGADLPTEGMTANQAIEIVNRIKPLLRIGKKLTPDQQSDYDRYREFVKTKAYGRS